MTSPSSTPPRAGAPTSRPRGSRHLMDPGNLAAHRTTQRSLTRVQRWVMSTLATTTVLHLSVGLVIAALTLDDPRTGARGGLLVIAGAFGMVAVAVGLMIHRRAALSGWLVLGWIPSLVGAVLLSAR